MSFGFEEYKELGGACGRHRTPGVTLGDPVGTSHSGVFVELPVLPLHPRPGTGQRREAIYFYCVCFWRGPSVLGMCGVSAGLVGGACVQSIMLPNAWCSDTKRAYAFFTCVSVSAFLFDEC
jgi:hypothetical protein